MTASAFQAGVESWHDFYLAVGSASAALLGLLFVGVSINLSSITSAERADLRTRANLAFSNLLYLLCISLIVLIPGSDATSLAVSFIAVAGVGLLRNARRGIRLIHGMNRSWKDFATIRRLSWTVVADLVLLYVAALLASRGDAVALYYATGVVFVLLIGAADVAWGLLVEEDEDTHEADGPPASRHPDG
jgi:hypothetical protein